MQLVINIHRLPSIELMDHFTTKEETKKNERVLRSVKMSCGSTEGQRCKNPFMGLYSGNPEATFAINRKSKLLLFALSRLV